MSTFETVKFDIFPRNEALKKSDSELCKIKFQYFFHVEIMLASCIIRGRSFVQFTLIKTIPPVLTTNSREPVKNENYFDVFSRFSKSLKNLKLSWIISGVLWGCFSYNVKVSIEDFYSLSIGDVVLKSLISTLSEIIQWRVEKSRRQTKASGPHVAYSAFYMASVGLRVFFRRHPFSEENKINCSFFKVVVYTNSLSYKKKGCMSHETCL